MATPKSPPKRGHAAVQARKRRMMIWIIGGVIGVAAIVGISVLTVQGAFGPDVPVDEVAGELSIEGEPIGPPPEDPSADPAIGGPSPVITSQDLDGQSVTIGEAGTPQLVMFMASWCPICDQELPEVVSWLESGGLPDDVELTSVSTGLDARRPNWPPQDWYDRHGYDGRVLVDDEDGTASGTFGMPATPYWVAIDADGNIVQRFSGAIGQDQMTALAQQVSEL